MGNTTGTTGAGNRAYSSREIYDHFGGDNANTSDMSSADLMAYQRAQTAMAKSGAPSVSATSSAPVLAAGSATSSAPVLAAVSGAPSVSGAPAATPASAANPLAYLSAFNQAPNTGGIDPYSGTSQSLADMSSADLMKYYADRSATAAANPAGNPANATAAANGNLNSIPAPNSNVYNPYAGTPSTGGSTGNAGTNTFTGANPMSVVTAPAAGSAIAPSSLPAAPATTPASLPATTPAATLGGLPAGTATSPAGSTASNPFNNAPNSTVLNPYMMQQAQAIMDMQNRNLNEGAFQQIKDSAMMNGGYGGDRQGIAEGVAMRGADQNIRAQLGSLFSNAYESQAGRDLSRYQGDQGNAVSRFGIQTGANTAAMNLQGQQAMANAQLQAGMESNRNNFYTQQRGQDFEQQRLGMQLYGQGQQGLMGGYQGLGSIYDVNNAAPWEQLQRYSNLAGPFLGGGSTTAPAADRSAQYAQAAATVAAAVL